VNAGFYVLIILVLFVLWLILVRPQRRRRLVQEAMIDNLRVGDEVITAGGFFVTVLEIADDEVTVELSPGAQARLSKRAIAAVFPLEGEVREQVEEAVVEPTGQTPR